MNTHRLFAFAVILGLIPLILLSCRNNNHLVLKEDKFVSVYVQLSRVGSGSDSLLARHRADSVLQQAGVTREQMQATVLWLNRDVTRWKRVFDEIGQTMRDSMETTGFR